MTTDTLSKTSRRVFDVLEPDESRALLKLPDRRTAVGRRDAALIGVLGSGLRSIEAVRLTVGNIRMDRGRVLLEFATAKRKAGREERRTVILDTAASKAVKEWIAFSKPVVWLFPGSPRRFGQAGNHMSTDTAQKATVKYLTELAEKAPSVDSARLARIRTHGLRHSFVTQVILETNGNVFLASKLAGHQSIELTARVYGHVDRSAAREVADVRERAMAWRKNASEKVRTAR